MPELIKMPRQDDLRHARSQSRIECTSTAMMKDRRASRKYEIMRHLADDEVLIVYGAVQFFSQPCREDRPAAPGRR